MIQALRFEILLLRLQSSFWMFWLLFSGGIFLSIAVGSQVILYFIESSASLSWLLTEESLGRGVGWAFRYIEMAVIYLIFNRIIDENRSGMLAAFVMEGLSRTQVFLGRWIYTLLLAVLLKGVLILSVVLMNGLVGVSLFSGLDVGELSLGLFRVFGHFSFVMSVIHFIPSLACVFVLLGWGYLLEPLLHYYLQQIWGIEQSFLPLNVFSSFQSNPFSSAQPLEGSQTPGLSTLLALLYLGLFWGAIYWKLKFRDFES